MSALLIFLVRVYRLTLSPAQIFLFGPNAGCRFTPTCSQYAIEALQTHGAIRGSWLATKRICRCHPWGECGCDPIPKAPGVNGRTRHSVRAATHTCGGQRTARPTDYQMPSKFSVLSGGSH